MIEIIANFAAGALLCNCIPHLTAGLRGERFPSPFGKSMEARATELLQNNCKPKRLVTNNELEARRTNGEIGICKQTRRVQTKGTGSPTPNPFSSLCNRLTVRNSKRFVCMWRDAIQFPHNLAADGAHRECWGV